ncbi:MAG: hypothetical protein HKP20_04615 [Akkermansiaceae bacterium]|nr:hypothetical protein [Akkermansiaceae bacterium]
MSAIVFFVVGGYEQNITYLIMAGASLALIFLLQMIHSIENSKIICPNCRSQILRSSRCSKHRMAKKLLGSYSLRLAFQVVFTNSFLCQFCNQTYQWRGKNFVRPRKPEGSIYSLLGTGELLSHHPPSRTSNRSSRPATSQGT